MITDNRSDRPLLAVTLYLGNLLIMVAISALVKKLTEQYPVQQVLLFRFLFVALPMLVIVGLGTGFASLKTTRYTDHAIRAIAGIVSLSLFFYAISQIPMAEATMLAYSSPIFIVILSIPILAEKIGVWRWSAVIAGFVGVLVIVQPGVATISFGSMAAVASAVTAAIVMIWLRILSTTEKVTTISVIYNGAGVLVFLVWIGVAGWVPIQSGLDWMLLILTGLIASFQQYMFVSAFRYGEASMLAPFEYLILVFSALVGYLFWAEVPPLTTWIGGVVIVCSGLFIIFREQKRGSVSRKGQKFRV